MTSLITAVTRGQGLGISLGYCEYDNQNFDSRLHVLSWETKKIYNVDTKRISQLLNKENQTKCRNRTTKSRSHVTHKFIPPPWYKETGGGGRGGWMEPLPRAFDMLQYFETILPLVQRL